MRNSIRELLELNSNKPMWLIEDDDKNPRKFFVVGIAPDGWAIGWNSDGTADYYQANRRGWKSGETSVGAVWPRDAVVS